MAAILSLQGVCKAEESGIPAAETSPVPMAPLYGIQGSVASNRAVRESEQARAVARARELNALKAAMAAQSTVTRPVASTASEFLAMNPTAPREAGPADGSPRSTPSVPLANPGVPAFDLSGSASLQGGGGSQDRPSILSGLRGAADDAVGASGFDLPSRETGERRGLPFFSRLDRRSGGEASLPSVGASTYEMPPAPDAGRDGTLVDGTLVESAGPGRGPGAGTESGEGIPDAPAFDLPPVGPAGEATSRVEPPTPAMEMAALPAEVENRASGESSAFDVGLPSSEENRGGLLSFFRPREQAAEPSRPALGGFASGVLAAREARAVSEPSSGRADSGPQGESIFLNRSGEAERDDAWRPLTGSGRIETGGVLVALHPGDEVRVIEGLGGGRMRVQLRDGRVGDLDEDLLAP